MDRNNQSFSFSCLSSSLLVILSFTSDTNFFTGRRQTCSWAPTSVMLNSWRQQHDTSTQVFCWISWQSHAAQQCFHTGLKSKCVILPGILCDVINKPSFQWKCLILQIKWFNSFLEILDTCLSAHVCACMCCWSIQIVSQHITTRNRKQLPASHPSLPLTHTTCQVGEDSLRYSAE